MMSMKVETCSTLLGDNYLVTLNTQYPFSFLKKKYKSVQFHKVREAVTAVFVRTGKFYRKQNLADATTKPLVPIYIYRLTFSFLYNLKQDDA